ncbi:MAG: alanine racemase [Thermodesulfovibrionales bacterium]|nr:alanine racemase [Thermodesulfovibrionales bacterium]
MNRGAIAEINLSAIAHNLEIVKRVSKDSAVIAVVKADAYGHGCREISKRLIKEGVSYLAVAYTGEAILLRDAGITAPIIVLFDREDIEGFFDFDLVPVIHDITTALALSRVARGRRTTIKVHVKVDTGMGRLGLSSNHLIENLVKIADMEGIELAGLMSHFSDADLSDRSYAAVQLERFNKIREALFKKLNKKIFSHIANSAAALAFEDAHLDAVRPGLMLYGYSPLGQNKNTEPINLIPAMKVKTKILCIRNLPPDSPISYGRTFVTKRRSKIGVLPVGYADGYDRLFSNNAEVLVRGRRVPVVGRICMDITMVDLTEVEDVREGDEVVILGQQGDESITAHELACKARTIPYEILTSLGSHSRKEYIYPVRKGGFLTGQMFKERR